MTTIEEMIATYPQDLGNIDRGRLADAIEACFTCAQACTACADSCLSEQRVAELTTCIRANLDCAQICLATGSLLSRHTGYDANLTWAMLQACALACNACAQACGSHAGELEHCRVCADCCARAERACRDLLDALGPIESPMSRDSRASWTGQQGTGNVDLRAASRIGAPRSAGDVPGGTPQR